MFISPQAKDFHRAVESGEKLASASKGGILKLTP
jgi:hypothetical protein